MSRLKVIVFVICIGLALVWTTAALIIALDGSIETIPTQEAPRQRPRDLKLEVRDSG